MALVFASLLAGLGLFFVGLRLLTDNLKLLSGRRLRVRIAQWTKRPLLGVLWGGMFIAITQSSPAATFILIGMLRAGMMSVRQILPILIGINMVAGLIVMVLTFDLRLAVFFLLGATGVLYALDFPGRVRAVAGAAFGVGLLFLGLATTQSGVGPLSSTPWFETALTWTTLSYMIGFAIGAILGFVIQSSLAIVVLAIAFLQGGLLSLEQAIMITYGSKVGSAALTLALSSGLSGSSKQVTAFQAGFNLLGVAILVPAFYVETAGGVPLVAALAALAADTAAMQLAVINLIFNIVPGVLLLFLLEPAARRLERLYPDTLEDRASKPKYLHEHAGEDPVSAIGLIELEQVRLVEILPQYFEAMRQRAGASGLGGLREAFRSLSATIREVIVDLSHRQRLAAELYERLNAVLKVQHGLEAAHDEVYGLGAELETLRSTERGERFARVAVDGLDAIVLSLLDVARERSATDMAFLEKMTSEDGITRVRKAYLAEDAGLTPAQRLQLLSAANRCERLVWLVHDLCKSYRSLGTREADVAL